MNIVMDSNRVLLSIYNLLDEDSYTLYVEFNMKEFAEKVNMSKKYLNLCIHYLIENGYLQGDFAYNESDNAKKQVMLTSNAIREIERQL